MKVFLETIVWLLIIKGSLYLLFPQWMQRFVAENIINAPINRLKMLGALQLLLALALYSYISKKFGI